MRLRLFQNAAVPGSAPRLYCKGLVYNVPDPIAARLLSKGIAESADDAPAIEEPEGVVIAGEPEFGDPDYDYNAQAIKQSRIDAHQARMEAAAKISRRMWHPELDRRPAPVAVTLIAEAPVERSSEVPPVRSSKFSRTDDEMKAAIIAICDNRDRRGEPPLNMDGILPLLRERLPGVDPDAALALMRSDPDLAARRRPRGRPPNAA